MLSINTNLSSLLAQSSMQSSTQLLSQAVERMSTGYKINHAKDNAANYSIATNMTTKMGALQVAEDNAMQGLEMMSTTTENLSLIEEKLVRMRALAVQAQNGTYGSQSLSALSSEADSLYAEINRINECASYNGIKLFNTGKDEVTNAGKELELNAQGFLQEVVKVDTTGMTALSSMDDEAMLAVGEYTISSKEELLQLKEMSDAGLLEAGSTFVLTKDIDMRGITDWTGIGATNAFKGVFDGNGHTISNLTGSQGLFSNVQRKTSADRYSEIKNVKLLKVDINATGNTTGAVCGSASDAKITNCSVEFANIISEYDKVSGIVASAYYANTSYCYFSGNISGVNAVAGILNGNYSTASYCITSGFIKGISNVGGIVGSGFVHTSRSDAVVKGISNVGGIAGRSNSVSSDLCFSGSVVGESNVGGIVGNLYTQTSTKGWILEGLVIGNANAGIFVGDGNSTSQENLYYYSKNSEGLNFIGSYPDAIIKNVVDITIPCDYTLQVGYTGEAARSTLSCTTYIDFGGLKDLLSNGIASIDSIKKIDDLVNIVSLKQTELGAVEQRLHSVLDEISTQYENLVSSRSTIRDADISEVSATYIQQQILQQAAATLMSTANQAPAIALQLI